MTVSTWSEGIRSCVSNGGGNVDADLVHRLGRERVDVAGRFSAGAGDAEFIAGGARRMPSAMWLRQELPVQRMRTKGMSDFTIGSGNGVISNTATNPGQNPVATNLAFWMAGSKRISRREGWPQKPNRCNNSPLAVRGGDDGRIIAGLKVKPGTVMKDKKSRKEKEKAGRPNRQATPANNCQARPRRKTAQSSPQSSSRH